MDSSSERIRPARSADTGHPATSLPGRKRFDYLFAGSDAGGERAAAIYSLLGTAKLNGHNPEAFLREVIARIAEHPITRINELLLPWHLQATRTNPLTGNGATPKLPP